MPLLVLRTSVSAEAVTHGASGDCNSNGVSDNVDINSGTSNDCNENGVPDECDIALGTSQDCNNNSIPDECEIGARPIINQSPQSGNATTYADANNGSATGFTSSAAESFRLSANARLTSFRELGAYFPGDNHSSTSFTITIRDSNVGGGPGSVLYTQTGLVPNLIPTGTTFGGVPVYNVRFAIPGGTDLAPGKYWLETFEENAANDPYLWLPALTDPTSGDNGAMQALNQSAPASSWSPIPNSLALIIDVPASGTDCNENGIPDDCESLPDCNNNRFPDVCDIASGRSTDYNNNGIPDECESLPDCNDNDVPDAGDLLDTSVLNQSPSDGVTGRFADVAALFGAQTTSAQSFVLASPYTLQTFTERGIYFGNGNTTGTAFTIYLRANNAGAPGTVLHTQSNVVPVLTATGATLFGTAEYKLDFTIAPQLLAPGTYWIETQETNPSNAAYVWLSAPGDFSAPANPGARFAAQAAPGTVWDNPNLRLALTIGKPAFSTDYNNNGVPDECDIADGTSEDCNNNGIPDEIDIASRVLINQMPRSGITGTYADANNGLAGSGSNSTAESFRVTSTAQINAITTLAVYFPSNNSTNSTVTLYVRSDNGSGQPGAIVYGQTGTVPVLTPTGGNYAGTPELSVRLPFNYVVTLNPGKYWIELFEENPTNGRFVWLEATTDPNTGDPGHFTAQGTPPGSTWNAGGASLSLFIESVPFSTDCNNNGVPDECENLPDCNKNGIPDACENLPDCNNNGTPDVCDIASGHSPDRNENGIPDECDIEDGTSEDCNDNGIPDEVEIDGIFRINQSPADGVSGAFGDADVFGNGPNSAAESFHLATPYYLTAFSELGIFYPAGTFPNPTFKIIVHADNAGNPGAILLTQSGVVPTLTPTGNTRFGCTEYRLDFALSGVYLPAGTYWIETFEQNTGSSGYVWLSAGTDPVSGAAGTRQASGQAAPGTTWSPLNYSLALTIGTAPTSTDINHNRVPDECENITDCNHNGVPDDYDINGSLMLNQSPPTGVTNFYSDVSAGFGSGPYTCAESFHITAPYFFRTFTEFGFFSPNNTTSAAFAVLIRADASGAPGAVLHSFPSVIPTLTPTGGTAMGSPVQKLHFTIPNGVTLAPGTYWLETQELNPANGSFCWLTAAADSTYGSAGSKQVIGQNAPGTTWISLSSSFALVIGEPGTSEDCNNNGIPDECEQLADCNDNDIPDVCEIAQGLTPDCNNNGVPDLCDILLGTSKDCNKNGVPDECESLDDCNENGIADVCELASGAAFDLNNNGVLDECDIKDGTSSDCNNNGIPDEVDIAGHIVMNQWQVYGNASVGADMSFPSQYYFSPSTGAESFHLNSSFFLDRFVIYGVYRPSNDATDTSFDVYLRADNSGTPGAVLYSETDIAPTRTPAGSVSLGQSFKLQFALHGVMLPPGTYWLELMETNPGNGEFGWLSAVPDSSASAPGCYLANQAAPGTNWYFTPAYTPSLIIGTEPISADCNDNGIPDECERLPDCNKNGIPDECDIADGTSEDCNNNGVPDECEIAQGTLHDCDNDGIADECQSFRDCNENGVPDTCDIEGHVIIDQTPADGITGAFGDVNVFLFNQQISSAESFRVASLYNLDGFSQRGIYWPANNAANTSFTIRVRADNAGNPGTVIFTSTGNVPTLTPTGNTRFGCTEYNLGFAMPSLLLTSGKYWIETLEENPNNSSYVWLSAPTDAPSGDPGSRQTSGGSAGGPAWESLDYSLALYIGKPGTSTDCNNNGVPDECENLPDCNKNGTPDACDIASGNSKDINKNGVPDECEQVADCNHNGVPDNIDISGNAILTQLPNGAGGTYCDVKSNFSSAQNPATAAENFHINASYFLTTFTEFGVYLPGNNTTSTSFAVYVRADNSGTPGAILFSQTGVVPTLTPTGVMRFGAPEHKLKFNIAGVTLPAGTYWIETMEENPSNSSYLWGSAPTDPTTGILGVKWAQQAAPASNWSNGAGSLALIIGEPATSTDNNHDGIPDECQQSGSIWQVK